MKAIVYQGPRDFVVAERADPKPSAREVLIRPLYAGLCFSDKHWYEGGRALVGGDKGLAPAAGPSQGMIGGHEFSGRVVAVGSEVDSVQPGQLVSVDPRVYCGKCLRCRAGLESLCTDGRVLLGANAGYDGGLAELCVVPEYSCYVLPAGISPLAAACVEPLSCATRAMRHGGIRIGDNIAVLGAEDYNVFSVNWLRAAGASKVVVADPEKVRRDSASSMGAHLVLDPREGDLVAAVQQEMPLGADVVLVACEDYVKESQQYLEWAFDICRPQGTVIVMRVYNSEPWGHVAPKVPWTREITLKHFGIWWGNEPALGGRQRGDWQLTLDAIADGRVRAPIPGTNVVKFDDLRSKRDVDDMFEALPHSHMKTIVEIGEP
jgi:threonine dehydrogenase-like Zn-dependent dehydrogenase